MNTLHKGDNQDNNKKHKKVAGYIHWKMCKYMGLQVTDKYYEQILERIIEVNSATIIWYVLVITDQTILAKPLISTA